MPNWYPSYTSCTQPGSYQSVPIVAMVVFSVGGLAGLIAQLAGVAPGIAPVLGLGLCAAGIALCHWWLYVRLICLGGDRSATGAIYSLEPYSFSNDIFDTDYSFNLLLWGFVPQNELPGWFVSNEWSDTALTQLATEWASLPPFVPPNMSWASVANLVTLIVAQPSLAQVVSDDGIVFNGQGVDSVDQASPPLANGSNQHFVLHCEIEGSGMRDILALLIAAAVLFAAALIFSGIPIVSIIISIIAILLVLIGGGIISNSPASPPTQGGFGGTFNPYRPGDNPNQPVDLAYVFGRWVCDSGFMHGAGNELHPVHYMCKIGETTQGAIAGGNWPGDVGEIQVKLDDFFAYINSPAAGVLQQQPENQWTLHPVLDGCQGATPYPVPPPP